MGFDYTTVTNPRASYWLKVQRAEKHAEELEGLLAPYGEAGADYVRESFDPKLKNYDYRAWVKRESDDNIAVVLGDYLNNMRSALDHVRAALVPSNRRRKGYFPIFDEDFRLQGREADQERWDTYVKGMKPQAIACILDIQPFQVHKGQPGALPEHHALKILNAWTNADKHKALVPVISGIQLHGVNVIDLERVDDLLSRAALRRDLGPGQNGALIHQSKRKVNVHAFGATVVAIETPGGVHQIRNIVPFMTQWIADEVIRPLDSML